MASRSVNKVILLGHLGRDAETKFTPSGVSRSTFTIATNRRWKDQQSGEWKEETDWHNCVIWRSENVANYLLNLSNVLGIDLSDAILAKIAKNAIKYPAEKYRGRFEIPLQKGV